MFHNTVNLSIKEHQKMNKSASRQEDEVLAFFRENPDYKCSAETILEAVLPNSPRTSTGRALSNLSKWGCIDKLNDTVIGEWGVRIHLWALSEREVNKLKPCAGSITL